MPIDVESTRWKKSTRIDILRVKLERFLRANSEKAYTPSELTEHLTEEHPEVFPETLLAEKRTTRAARIVLVTSQLEILVWHGRVEARSPDNKLYYTEREGGQFPIAEIEQKIPRRFIELEQKVTELEDELNSTQCWLQEFEEDHPGSPDFQSED